MSASSNRRSGHLTPSPARAADSRNASTVSGTPARVAKHARAASPVRVDAPPVLDAVSRLVIDRYFDAPTAVNVFLVERARAAGPLTSRSIVYTQRDGGGGHLEVVVADLENTEQVVSRFPVSTLGNVPGADGRRSYAAHTFLADGAYGKVFRATASDFTRDCVVKVQFPVYNSKWLEADRDPTVARCREWANLHGSILLEGYISIAAGELGAGVPMQSVSMCRTRADSTDAGLVGCTSVSDLFDTSFDEAIYRGRISFGAAEAETMCHQFTYDGDYLAILRLVDTVHQSGILHRDLHAGNLLVRYRAPGEAPVYRLSDFGLGLVVDQSQPGLRRDFDLLRAHDFVMITLTIAYWMSFRAKVHTPAERGRVWEETRREFVRRLREWAPRPRNHPDPTARGFGLDVEFIDAILVAAGRAESFLDPVQRTGPNRLTYIAEYERARIYHETDIAVLRCLAGSYPDTQLRAIGPSGVDLRTACGEMARDRDPVLASEFAAEFERVRGVCRILQSAKPRILDAYRV